jgi:solute carrier family 25 (mitochondrial carnitine/acylcarnitine transporter), member 20/29
LYSGVVDCVKKTYKWEGIVGFYKGVASPLVGQMFFRANMFFSYGQSVVLLKHISGSNSKTMTLPWYFVAGFLTGLGVSFIECPIDLFKSQVQVEIINTRNTGAPAKYSSVFNCAKTIYSTRGIRGCYQGLLPTLCRNSIAGSFYFGKCFIWISIMQIPLI